MENKPTSNLPEQLQQQIQNDLLAARALTSQLLRNHADELRKFSRSELNITRNVIQEAQQEMVKEFGVGFNKLQRWTTSLKWVPVVLTALVCAVIFLGTSLLTVWEINAKKQQIQQLTKQFCASPAGKNNCR